MSASSWQKCKVNLEKGCPATSDRERWLLGLYEHLGHMDSGLLKKKDSMQNVNEMRRILEAVDKGRDDIDCLVSGDRENIWHFWIKPTLIASDPAKKRKG